MFEEKKRDQTKSYDKTPTPIEKSKKQRDNTKTHQNFDYATIATQLVRLDRFTGSKPSHLPEKLCYQTDTHL